MATKPSLQSKRRKNYGGDLYTNKATLAADTATRFETTPYKLNDVVFLVKTNNMLFGDDATTQDYPVGVDETVGFTMCDISTMYFKNATAGNNGVVHIIGVKE